MNNNQKLIDAINCKYPHNNLIELYYNIGRALPFVAQRFPDGRVSDWYRNQYVEVVKVAPRGKYGKYGSAFGFYFRNGERADSFENDPENSWCRQTDTEPQTIPNSGCGGWVLLDILGTPTDKSLKLLGLDDQIGFGKYKDKTIKEIVECDWFYLKWAISESQNLMVDIEQIIKYHELMVKPILPNDILTFGKYKGHTLFDVYCKDTKYLEWLASNKPDFKISWDKLLALKKSQ